jgi:hypothetical protein
MPSSRLPLILQTEVAEWRMGVRPDHQRREGPRRRMLIQEIAMNVLEKSLLPEVVGGSVYDSGTSTMADGGGGGGYGGGSDFNWGFFGDSFASAGGFDGNGVGANSCVAAPSSGLFGYTFTETLAGAGAAAGLATGLATGIGQGIGASAAIEAAGGFGALGTMGAGAVGVGSAMVVGAGSALIVGGLIGTAAYHGSEPVRYVAIGAVSAVMEIGEALHDIGVYLRDHVHP